jgi:hypothetical protein
VLCATSGRGLPLSYTVIVNQAVCHVRTEVTESDGGDENDPGNRMVAIRACNRNSVNQI